ncbi:MAG: 3-isopropylmalate dehydratase small subunit [Candidatus Rokubacteria bacterium]|nr:3-isopropylmalate dehydratase small subunit [Candidatus Rokubacteria bacterium]
MSVDTRRGVVAGRGIPLPGNDIDTDRIIPARFLKAVTFAGLGAHAFEDARKHDPEHPFNQEVYAGAAIMVVGQNFGCGSSREHAPQALLDWGIRALVGVSFAEIFFGNCLTNGMPCLSASMEDILWLQREVGRQPSAEVVVDIGRQEVRFAGRAIRATIPDGPRHHLVDGSWNTTGVLLEAGPAIEATARRLPYIAGY